MKLVKDDDVSKRVGDGTVYQSMVGSLLYASTATRPDIAQAVGAVSKFCSQSNATHFMAIKMILHYLEI